MLGLALGVTLLGCGTTRPAETAAPPAATPAAQAPAAKPDAGEMTLASDDAFIANGEEIVRRLVDIFTNDGQDCEKLATDVTKLSADPIWAASTRYEDAHPQVRDRFRQESDAMRQQFAAVAMRAMTACAENQAFADALAKMQ